MEDSPVRRRVGLFLLVVAAVFVLLVGRLGQLQLVRGGRFEELARGNRLRILPINAPRGEIVDRNGLVLASNRPAFTVSLVQMGTEEELAPTLSRLSWILDVPLAELEDKIRAQRGRLYEPVRLKADVPPEVVTYIEEHRLELPGVVVETQPVRSYPRGAVAAHVLGYLREIDAESLKTMASEGYRLGDTVGKLGVEAVYDGYLRGEDGGRQVEVDARGRPVRDLGQTLPRPGDRLQLTLDLPLQETAERALEETMSRLSARSAGAHPVTKGAVVAIDPQSGRILALVSAPAFDPNAFVGRLSPEQWAAVNDPAQNPLLDRATQGTYPPGSAFKMVTAAAALETGVTSAQERFDTHGDIYWVSPTEFKVCWGLQYGGHGVLSLPWGLGKSCNMVFFELGRRVGVDTLAQYAYEFGFGRPTGLSDLPSEQAGLVPTRAWKRQAYPQDPEWYLSETLDAAIGQGFHQCTPLQMACYVGTLANGGTRYRPYLVEKATSPTGQVVFQNQPQVTGRANVSAETLAVIREGMIDVTRPGGTAGGVFEGFPLPVAGKTGTVERSLPGQEPHAWFVAYAPVDQPRIALAVLVEEGGGGALAAAPVARAMLERYLNIYPASPLEEGGIVTSPPNR